jgi:hypothetical protein
MTSKMRTASVAYSSGRRQSCVMIKCTVISAAGDIKVHGSTRAMHCKPSGKDGEVVPMPSMPCVPTCTPRMLQAPTPVHVID